MFNEGYSFPHPVLGNEDDISGEFKLSLDISRTDNRKILFSNVRVDVTNPYIKQQLESGKANCFLKIYCSSTLMTWVLELKDQFELNEDDLINKVELQATIIAKAEIKNYSDATFNSEYGSQSFSLGKKEVMATSGKISLPIPKINEKLGLGNIFQFYPFKEQRPIEFELDHDKIFINYPVTGTGEHPPNMLFSKSPWAAFNIFIVPALTEALRYIDKEPEEASRWEWFTVIDQLLPEEDRSTNYFTDAQKIIQGQIPILLAYDELTK